MHKYTFTPAHRWMRCCSVAGIRRPAAATPRQHYVGDSPLSASTQHDIINTRQLTTPRARTAYMVPYPPTKVPFPMGDVNPHLIRGSQSPQESVLKTKASQAPPAVHSAGVNRPSHGTSDGLQNGGLFTSASKFALLTMVGI